MLSRSSLLSLLLLTLAYVLTLVEAHSSSTHSTSTAPTTQSSSSRPFTATDYHRIFGYSEYSWYEKHRLQYEQGIEEDSSRVAYDYQTPQNLTQQLDHFDSTNQATWTQTYYVNTQFVNESITPPIVFLVVGGESAADVGALASKNPAYQAQHFGALIVLLEHRFYGNSVPYKNHSTANLRYLTTQQALADLVTFRTHIIEQYNLGEESQWIVVGCSYAGALSAWARLKYPHLFVGSIASSATIEAELDFDQFNEVVEVSLGPQCSSQVAAAFATVTQMLNTSDGQAQLETDFDTCGQFTSEEDIQLFMSSLASPIQSTVQYDGDDGGIYNISSICDYMVQPANSTSTPYQDFVAYSASTNQGQCTSVSYAESIAYIQSPNDYRSWVWQTCTELGYMITDDAQDQPFGHLVTLRYNEQICADVFVTPNMLPNVTFIDDYYGGANIVTTNTFFTQGSLDPWHALGNKQVYANGSSSQNVNVMISGTGHVRDYEAPQSFDSAQLRAVRAQQLDMIALWLS